MTDMTQDEALRLRIIEAAVEWAGQKAGEPYQGAERRGLELVASKVLQMVEREYLPFSRPAPAPGSAEVEALCEELEGAKTGPLAVRPSVKTCHKAAALIRALAAERDALAQRGEELGEK